MNEVSPLFQSRHTIEQQILKSNMLRARQTLDWRSAESYEKSRRETAMLSDMPRPGQFYILRPDATRGGEGHGVEFVNEKRLLTPPRLILRPRAGGFPPLAEPPLLRYDPKLGVPPEDLEGGMSGYWLVSDRLKSVLTAVDPAGFSFQTCDYRLADGSSGPSYSLCDVVRTVDALNEEASQLTIEISDEFPEGKYYNLIGASLAFHKDRIANAHVFKTPYSGQFVFCDRIMRDAILEAGMGQESASRGVWLTDVFDI